MKRYYNIRYNDRHLDNVLDLYIPDEINRPPLLVYIHGGGWTMGDKRDDLLDHWMYLVNRGYALASINYRMNKEGKHPNGFQDVQDAVKFLYDKAGQYNYDPERIGIIGESAGGFYSLLLAATNDQPVFGREALNLPIKACISLYAPVDFLNGKLEITGNPFKFLKNFISIKFTEVYFNKDFQKLRDEELLTASPVNYLNENIPPVLFQQGTKDRLIPSSQADWLRKKSEELNLSDKIEIEIFKGADHLDQMFFTKQNKDRIEEFLSVHLKEDQGDTD